MSIPSLTTETKVRIRLSTVGVDKRIDHLPAGALDDVISQASSDVAMFLGRYQISTLPSSDVVSNWTADVAVYHLCRIRANPIPTSVKDRFEWVMEQLALVQEGKKPIPDLDNSGSAPAIVNYSYQPDKNPKKRREETASYPSVPIGFPSYPDRRMPPPR